MNAATLAQEILAQDRRALARAITLVESKKKEHRALADDVLALLPEHHDTTRIGISGTPGVGKSTFIEAFGLHALDAGRTLAVLAVDPSSPKTGGSILGDKTRMDKLSRHPNAFIRPSPSQGALGGVAPKTHDAILLCEAAGFDTIVVETVGTGQSEVTVSELTDAFLLLIAPGGGDELQGVKRGVLELCDVLLVNKADGELKPKAQQTLREYRAGLQLLRGHERVKTAPVSALTGEGLAHAWTLLQEYLNAQRRQGHFLARRAGQRERLLERTFGHSLKTRFFEDRLRAALFEKCAAEVRRGTLSVSSAALRLTDEIFRER